MSILLRGEAQYDPDKEYFFVDYSDRLECRRIRHPYMTLEEVQDLISHHLPFIYDNDEHKCVPMFSGLRITPMSKLEELNKSWNQETGQYEDDEITVARRLFGSFYDGYDWIEHPSMLPSLTRKEEETAEEWKSRVEEQRKELEERHDRHTEILHAHKERLRERYSNYRLALLKGRSMRNKELKVLSEEEEMKAEKRYTED